MALVLLVVRISGSFLTTGFISAFKAPQKTCNDHQALSGKKGQCLASVLQLVEGDLLAIEGGGAGLQECLISYFPLYFFEGLIDGKIILTR